MAPSKPKLAWPSDQRELGLLIYASTDGKTHARLEWRYCQAGEERKTTAELGRWEWPGNINTRQHALWCLIQVARRMADQIENPVPNM